ncbi:MAG: glycosyltransferase family 4 protein [Thermoanaerobaculia bacterium]
MKILLVSHAPLTAELGASQIVLNLGAALRDRGHEAAVWTPGPLPPDTRWWNAWRRLTRAIEEHAADQGPFDVIDSPALSASRGLAGSGCLVVRSIQPELLYLFADVRADLTRRLVPSPRSVANALLGFDRAAAILGGWRRARRIVCLGSWEQAWMSRRFPRWSGKLGFYVCTPSPTESGAFAEIRSRRVPRPREEGTRFLWIGRWSAHKGTRRLVRLIGERASSHPRDRFTLAGCGLAPEQDLPASWLQSGLVRIVPSYRRDELPDLLAAHDAGLFTSSVEGWGLCLNEMLESGLTVYATPAGGVRDLRPFWGSRLRPFPPPADAPEPDGPEPDLDGYLSYFSWPEIARRYEEEILAARSQDG